MDLALVLEEIRPSARYRLNKSVPPEQVIIEWVGPGAEPTQQEFDDGWVIVNAKIQSEQEAEENRQTNQADAKARFLLSQLANKTPQQIYTQMQWRMDSWVSLGDARDDLREWLPLLAAVIAWKVIE